METKHTISVTRELIYVTKYTIEKYYLERTTA